MRKLSLAAWGGICIFGGLIGGLMSHLIMGLIDPPNNRAEMLVQGMAVMLFLILGVVLIGVGLAKDKRSR